MTDTLRSIGEFRGSRLGGFADLRTPEWRSAWGELEPWSDRYVRLSEPAWPKEYPWPRDALHVNTRVWEYPFVLDALRRYAPAPARVLDIGSALTFLPCFLQSQGYDVEASDIDQRMPGWAAEVYAAVERDPSWPKGRPLPRYALRDVTSEGGTGGFDVVTNISVLEHLPMDLLDAAVRSVHRALKPGGIFVCTLDCWLQGRRTPEHHPLDQAEFEAFLGKLGEAFTAVEPFTVRVPSDVLTNLRFPEEHAKAPPRPRAGLRQRVGAAGRAAVGRGEEPQLEWCAFGITLRAR